MKNQNWAYFVLRIATGINLLGHGLVRITGGNYIDFRQWLLETFAKSPLPLPLVELTAYVIPPVELLLGLLLVAGLWTRNTLLAASAVMMMLIFGSCMIQNWEIVGVQMIYIIIYAALLAFRDYNALAVDARMSSSLSKDPVQP